MSHVLAGAPGDCCFRTVQHVGEKRGTIEIVAGVETYVSRPKDGSNTKIVLFFADVFGPIYINSQLIMDYWADNGYLVVGLDYFEDDSMTKHPDREAPGFDYKEWIAGKKARAPQLVGPWVEAIRRDFGGPDTKYVCVGYCFGAPYVCEYLTKDWIVAGAFGHPAFLNEDHIRNVKKPLLLSCAEVDHTFPLDARRKAEDILVENKATYFIQVFGSVQHGFALRADLLAAYATAAWIVEWAREESARSILNWFNHFCD